MGTERCALTYEEKKKKKNVFKIYASATCVTKERCSKIILSSMDRFASSNSKFNFTTFGFLS